MQCSSDIQGLTAALAALQGMGQSEQVWVQRPGGVVLGLGQNQAVQVLKDGMNADCFAFQNRQMTCYNRRALINCILCRLDTLQRKTAAATAGTKSFNRSAGRSRGPGTIPARCSGIAVCSDSRIQAAKDRNSLPCRTLCCKVLTVHRSQLQTFSAAFGSVDNLLRKRRSFSPRH